MTYPRPYVYAEATDADTICINIGVSDRMCLSRTETAELIMYLNRALAAAQRISMHTIQDEMQRTRAAQETNR